MKDWKREGQRMRKDIDCGIMEYKCRKCKASFTRAKDAAYHQKKCVECKCSICNKIFTCELALKQHMNIHEKKYECETCHKAFSTKYILTRHTKVHSKQKDFACNYCNSKFTSKYNQKRHEKNCK